MANTFFFENEYPKLLVEIPKLIQGITYDSGEVYKHLKVGFGKLSPVTERNIKKSLGKPLPDEFYFFYSTIGLLNYHSLRENTPATIVQAEKMMDYKYAPILPLNEDFLIKKKYQKSPFWNVFFYPLHIDNLDFQNLDSLYKLNKLMRLKLILTHNTNIYHVAVDFNDPLKEYQLYHVERGDIYPIDLTFSQFVEGFMHLGDTLMWWTNFIKEEHKVGLNYPTWDDIEKQVKGFLRGMLLH